jgi:hypothetical protein
MYRLARKKGTGWACAWAYRRLGAEAVQKKKKKKNIKDQDVNLKEVGVWRSPGGLSCTYTPPTVKHLRQNQH